MIYACIVNICIVSCNVTSKQNKHTSADRSSDGLSGTLRLYWDLWCWSILHINTHTIHFLNIAPTHDTNSTMPDDVLINFCSPMIFSSTVQNGSGAFLMPSCLSVKIEGGGTLWSTSVTFSVFWHKASWGLDDINNIYEKFGWIAQKVIFTGQKVIIVPFLHCTPFSQKKLVSIFFSILAWTFQRMVLINYPKLDFIESLLRSFWHEASPGWRQLIGKRRISLNHS